MGTSVRLEIWVSEQELGKEVINSVFLEIRRLEELMSPYIPSSQLAKLNRDGFTQAILLDQELFQLLERAIAYSELTKGAFDITFASIGNLFAALPRDASVARLFSPDRTQLSVIRIAGSVLTAWLP